MMLNVALRSKVVWRSLDSPVGLFTKMALCLGANVAAAFSKKMGASKQSVKAKPATMALSPKVSSTVPCSLRQLLKIINKSLMDKIIISTTID